MVGLCVPLALTQLNRGVFFIATDPLLNVCGIFCQGFRYERGPRGVADNPFKDLLPTVARYSWAVPTPAALKLIASHAPLLEVGAGTGYWAWVLWQMGVDVIAYDASPGLALRNKFHRFKLGWYLVHKNDGAYAVVNHQQRTLLLCWPSDNHMSDRTLRAYQGQRMIYIGANDSEHGVYTGNKAFHQELKEKWQLIEELTLPSWGALVDKVRVYERA